MARSTGQAAGAGDVGNLQNQDFIRSLVISIQFLSADWQRTTSPDSFGHDVEVGYLMVESRARPWTEGMTRATGPWPVAWSITLLQYGWDNDRGGLYALGGNQP